jgi:hypothetical protein
MSWTSKYAARFTKPLKWQLYGIISRDIQAALNNVNPAAGYSPIVSYHKAALAIEQFPSLLLTTERQRFDAESDQTRKYSANFYCSVAVAHQDPNVVADMLEDYVLALDQVINSAWELTAEDFYSLQIPLPSPPFAAGATSPGIQAGSLGRIFVADVAYDETKQIGNKGFARAATMSIVADCEEI